MPDAAKSPKNYRKWIRLFLWSSAAAVLLVVLALVMLPYAVSSGAFKRWVQERAETALHRPLEIDTLQWGWSKGFLLERVVLSDDAGFSRDPLAAVDRLRADLSYGALLRGRVAFDLEMDGMRVNLIRREDGLTNLEALLSDLKRGVSAPDPSPSDADPEGDTPTRIVLPVDIKVRLNILNTTLRAVDRQQGRSVRAFAGRFILDVPSLRHAPVTLEMRTRLELNGQEIPPPFLTARIEALFSADGELQPAEAAVELKGAFPGGGLTLTGGLAALRTEFELDLAQLFEVAAPFLPGQMAETDIGGRIGLTAEMSGDPRQELQFFTTLTAQGLRAAGGVLEGRRVGPLRLKFVSNGNLDLEKETAAVETGEVHIQEKSRFDWQLHGRNLKQAAPEINLAVSRVVLDLNELTVLAEDFIPADIAFKLGGDKTSATLNLTKMEFSGKAPAGPHAFRMNGLSVQLPSLTLEAAGNLLVAEAVALTVKETRWEAQTLLPDKVTVDGALDIGRVHLKQPVDVQIKTLRVPSVAVRLENIGLSDKSLFGGTAKISLSQSLSWDELKYADMAQVADFRQSLSASVNLTSDASATVTVSGFSVYTPIVDFRHGDLGAVKTDLRLESTLRDLQINALTPLKADVGRLTARLRVGGFLDGNMEARAQNLGFAGLQSQGRVQLNLRRLTDNVLAGLKPAWSRKAKLGGKVDASWELAGRRPQPRELQALIDSGSEPRALIENSAFIERFNLTALLDRLWVDLPLAGEERLNVREISTKAPFEIKLKQGVRQLEAGGAVHVGRIGALPNLGRIEKKLGANLNFSVRLADLTSLKVNQRMALDPVPLKQVFNLDLAGLDKILPKAGKAPLSALLAHGQGTVKAGINLGKDTKLALNNDAVMEGDLDAGGTLQLVPGNRASARVWMNTDGLTARWGDLLAVDALQSRLNLAKTFVLAQGSRSAEAPGAALPLSQAVLNPDQEARLSTDSIFGQLQDPLQRPYGRDHTLKIGTAVVNLKPAAVKLNHAVMDLHLDEGLPRMDYVQMDLLGGTLVGAWSITRSGNGFALHLQGAFSGLDTRKLLPDMKQTGPEADAEVSGRVTLAVPLGTRPDRVIQGMALNLKMTQIGTDALERALYALDPTESNEEIVNQRRQLRLGTPRWVDVTVEYGNLSINGEVAIKGVGVAIPPIEGINIATLPIQAELEEALAALEPVLVLLRAASAGTLAVDPDGMPLFLN